MSNDDVKRVCLELVRADSEDEVLQILRLAGYWDNAVLWRYYGDYETNYNAIGNQQSRPEAALVEKLVNSVDARLMNECLVRGIDPEGPDAPQSIREAVARFFDGSMEPRSPTAGLIREWPDAMRTEVARGITLVATGARPEEGYPSLTIADCGEGQTPEMFPLTFLSLTKSNKLRIPFVQGKYNHGGSGVLQFCGKRNLQLIVSRRNPALVEPRNPHGADDQWAFTVVRREDPTGGVRNSVYTYLAPAGADRKPREGGVLRFSSDMMPIFPTGREAYVREAEWGSLIKLYEYEVGSFRTNILRKGGLLHRLDLMLPHVALPIRLHECREYGGHEGSYETTLTGVAVRLDDNKADNLEFEPTSSPISVSGEKMTVSIFAFKKGKAKTYVRDEGVVFVLNGQTHAFFSSDFFRRKSVGHSYLSDSLLVVVDCSQLSGRAREDLFMTSRDRLRGGDLRLAIESALEDLLKNHDGLRALRERRRREETDARLAEDRPLEQILERLLKSSPALARLLLEGAKLPNPFKPSGADENEARFKGKRYPTYFRFKGEAYGTELHKECHSNMRSRVSFETDAVDEYFSRDIDRGVFSLSLLGQTGKRSVEDYIMNLQNGVATLTVRLPANCRQGDRLRFVAEVTDRTRAEAFANIFEVIVKGPTAVRPPDDGNDRRKSPSKEKGDQRDRPTGLSLPKIRRVRRDEWAQHEPPYDEYTALRIKYSGAADETGASKDVYDFFVNVDNIYLKTEEKRARKEPEIAEAQFIYGLVIVGLAMIQAENSAGTRRKAGDEQNSDPQEGEENIEDRVEVVTRALATVILPIIDSLGSLEADDVGALEPAVVGE